MDLQEYLAQQEQQRARNSIRGAQNQQAGKVAELLTRNFLLSLGWGLVEFINIPYAVTYGEGGRIVSAKRTGEVVGDIFAMAPGGQFCLVEAKASSGPKLSYTVLEAHQIEALDIVEAGGGLPLISWVLEDTVRLYHWPIDGWRKRKPLTLEMGAPFLYADSSAP